MLADISKKPSVLGFLLVYFVKNLFARYRRTGSSYSLRQAYASSMLTIITITATPHVSPSVYSFSLMSHL